MFRFKLSLFVAVAVLTVALGFALTAESALACSPNDSGDCGTLPVVVLSGPEAAVEEQELLFPVPLDTSTNSGSCLPYRVDEHYRFQIRNLSGGLVWYEINDESFVLQVGQSKNHEFPKRLGGGCAGLTSYALPVIEFDNSYVADTTRNYTVGNYADYRFERSGDSLNLYLGAVASTGAGDGTANPPGTSSTVPVPHIAYGAAFWDSVTTDDGDRFTFSGERTDWVRIRMSSDEMDTYLELIGPNGNVIAWNDDEGGNLRRSYIYVGSLPLDGTYTIVASSYGNATGSYYLTLE